MTDKKKRNQVEAIANKHKFMLKNGFAKQEELRHPAEITLIGISLVSFSMGLQNGAFLGIYIIGFVLSVIDLPRLLGKDRSLASKLLSSHTTYYVAGGVAASMFFMSIGYPIPQPEFGLVAEALSGIGELIW